RGGRAGRRARVAADAAAHPARGDRLVRVARHPPTCSRKRPSGRVVKAADVRVPHARLLVATAAVIACAAILWLARGFNFYFDEWTVILPMNSSWTVYLQPHNEHPAMLLRLIYAVLLNTVGM